MTTTRPTAPTREGELPRLRAQLESCEAELARTPAHKRGSQWEADRLDERAWLMRTIARLEAE